MALEGPHLVYARVEDLLAQDTMKRALELARKVEELLEETRGAAAGAPASDSSRHSTRMARAMAASLVDELEAIVRPTRNVGAS